MKTLFSKSIIKYALFFNMLVFGYFATSCKEKCEEANWTIEGRLLHGTTLEPIKNVFFTAELYDKNEFTEKVTNQTPIGKAKTDDSGYFKIEYPCQGKNFDWIDFETEAPFGGYVRDNVPFEKHFKRTFYYSTEGSHRIILKESSPLNGDTLYIGLRSHKPSQEWLARDTFTYRPQEGWFTVRGGVGGHGTLIACRGSKLYDSVTKNTSSKDEDKYWWRILVSGDPVIDSTVVNY